MPIVLKDRVSLEKLCKPPLSTNSTYDEGKRRWTEIKLALNAMISAMNNEKKLSEDDLKLEVSSVMIRLSCDFVDQQLARGLPFVLKDFMSSDKLVKALEAEEAVAKHLLGRLKKFISPQELCMKWLQLERNEEDVYDLVLKALRLQEESKERGMTLTDRFVYDAVWQLMSNEERIQIVPSTKTAKALESKSDGSAMMAFAEEIYADNNELQRLSMKFQANAITVRKPQVKSESSSSGNWSERLRPESSSSGNWSDRLRPPKQPDLCHQCKKGFHWRRECPLNTEKNETKNVSLALVTAPMKRLERKQQVNGPALNPNLWD